MFSIYHSEEGQQVHSLDGRTHKHIFTHMPWIERFPLGCVYALMKGPWIVSLYHSILFRDSFNLYMGIIIGSHFKKRGQHVLLLV
jgi:hypothetical protein